ncbi:MULTISPECIES: hypothetical protein [Eubacterium]|uniref:hypothetical protein n=1 Tax=Eubacterium TaxID=1730 RepID=UPI0011C2393C|nr:MULTISPECIES: hypothetical protein [unclassified Eubacterium (in: firmicutes)]
MMKGKIRKILSLLMAFTMVMNLNLVTGYSVKAAVGYDVVITKVGIYQKDGATKVYADYKNVGAASVGSDFNMSFYVNRESIGTEKIAAGLGAGKTARVEYTVSGSYSGKCLVTAIADINDGNTSNNNRTSQRDVNSAEPVTEPETAEPETTTVAPTTPETTTEAPTTKPISDHVKITGITYSPENPKVGDTVKITVTAKNEGDQMVMNKHVAVKIGNQTLTGTITIEAHSEVSMNVSPWTPTEAGVFTADASIDIEGTKVTASRSNIAVAAAATENMEAKVVALGGFPSEIYEGDVITFTTLVKNTGNADIPAGTKHVVNMAIDGSSFQTVTLSQDIPAGGYVKIESNWTATRGGHTIVSQMEGSDVTKKINVKRKFNTDYTAVTGGVDMVVTDIGYHNVTTGEDDGTINVGDIIQFKAVGVNAGDTAKPAGVKCGMAFYINGSTYDTGGGMMWDDTFRGNDSSLAPGESHIFITNGGNRTDAGHGHLWKATEGTNTVEAYINDDDKDKTDEINRNNNRKTVTITIPYIVNSYFDTQDTADNVNVDAADVKPGVVTGLTCTKSNETKVSLSWNAADNATSYNVYKGSELIGTTTDCSYTYTGTFNVGDTASYTVKAVRGSAVGDGATIQVTTEATTSEVQAYGVPQTFDASGDVSMTVNDESVGVFKTRVYEEDKRIGTYATNNPVTFGNVAIFDYKGDASVRIKVNRTDINSVTIRPTRKGLSATQETKDGATYITINMKEGQQGQYSIEFNGSYKGANSIMLFAQDILNKPDNVWKTISSYEKTDDLVVPEGKILWIEGGAVLNGYVHCMNNSKIIGRGIITQNNWGPWGGNNRRNPVSVGYEPVYYDGNTPKNNGKGGTELGSSNVQVIGISILDPTGWAVNIRNSNNVLFKDVNVVSARSNGDGITIQSSYNVFLDGCFVRSSDDSIVVKNYDNINAHDIRVEDCTVWNDIAQCLEIGYETDMGGAGSSRCEAGYKNKDAKIYNVLFKNIDVVHRFHKGVATIHNGDNIPIYHIAYDGVYVDHKTKGTDNGGDGNDIDIEAYAVNRSDLSWTHNWHDVSGNTISDVWYTNVNVEGGNATVGNVQITDAHWGQTISDDFLSWKTLNFN